MIIVTGAAGFIGSCLVSKLNNKGFKDIILVDDFTSAEKNRNLANKIYLDRVDRVVFFEWLQKHSREIQFIFHIGARTDTTEFNMKVFDELNLNYSKKVWNACSSYNIPLIYASSAATYGDGSFGYDDDHRVIPMLQPLNPYGVSKNEFDKWVLLQQASPPYWYGLKFFNVYGPNEYHKGRMASVIYHAFNQASGIRHLASVGMKPEASSIKLFRSHNPKYRDGEQLRDFIYIRDVLDVIYYLMEYKKDPGIYNLGTGKARTFLDLAGALFAALNKPVEIRFIDTPEDIREKYQYFTEAVMNKLRSAGYTKPFYSLEEGIEEYVQGYLINQSVY